MLSHFCAARTVALLLLLSAAPLASTAGQDAHRRPASVSISPTEATVHVGQKQTFKAVVKGAQSAGILWTVQEEDGGQVTTGGVYTAPRHLGRFHVIATSKENPAAKAVATVTVVTWADIPDWIKRPKF